jgi:hypothetical protein
MEIVDLLITIVVVTILVTIVLAVVTYIAYKLRLSREPDRRDHDPDALQYFVLHDPPNLEVGPDGSPLEQLDRDVKSLEGHATQA